MPDLNPEDLVMRSVFIEVSDDSKLRQIAHETQTTRNELIRRAVKMLIKEHEGNKNV